MLTVVDTIHWSFAFLILLCAFTLGWIQLGRRVMLALVGIQFIIGLVYLGMIGAGAAALGGRLWLHILGWLLATIAYALGSRAGRSSRSKVVPALLSFIGLVLLVTTAWVGLAMHGRLIG